MQNPNSSRSAYVYPVKSLLAGRVQPDQPQTPRSSSTDDWSTQVPDLPTVVPSPMPSQEYYKPGHTHPIPSQYDLSQLSGPSPHAIEREIEDIGTASGIPLVALGVVSDTTLPTEVILPVVTSNDTFRSNLREHGKAGEWNFQSSQPGDSLQILSSPLYAPPTPIAAEADGEVPPFNISESGIVHLPPLSIAQMPAIDEIPSAGGHQGTILRRRKNARSLKKRWKMRLHKLARLDLRLIQSDGRQTPQARATRMTKPIRPSGFVPHKMKVGIM